MRAASPFRLAPTAAAVLGLLAAVAGAHAQSSAPAAPEAAASEPSANTIVVTGEKVRRSSQRTYTSTGVITGQQVEDLGLRDLRDALKLQGNVYTAPSNNGNNGITIRGINSEGIGAPGANMRPLTTLTIDGAAQSFEGVRRGQRGSWDVEQIEVARGPQSTLQGRNSLAGAITVRTYDPTDYWEGAARVTAGERHLFGPAVMLSGPITESKELSFRIAAETARGNKGIRYTDPSTAFLDDDEYRNVRGKLLYRPSAIRGLEVKLTLSDTLDDPAVTAVSGPDYFDRVYDVLQSSAERRRNKVRNRVLDVSYELRPGVTLSSVTAHVNTDAKLDGFGANYRRDEIRADSDTTQEFRYTYAPRDSQWSGVGGVFLGRFRNGRDSLVSDSGATVQDLQSQRRDTSAAVFGEVRWSFTPRWSATFGARYDSERGRLYFDDQKDGVVERTRSKHHAFLPKFVLAYDITPQQTIALTASTGYRAGFREPGESGEAGRDIKPEFLRSYEAAYRSTMMDGKLVLNGNVFYYDWRDQQITVTRPDNTNLTYTENAGRSHVVGSELSLAWRPSRRYDLGASFGITHSKLDEYKSALTGADWSGREFPEAPRLSGGLWATARFDGGWFLSADMTSRSRAFATADLANTLKVPGRTVVDMRAGYETPDFSAILFVENLLNRQYLTGRDINQGAYVGDLRRVGVTLTARF